jgi:hypothetical protein
MTWDLRTVEGRGEQQIADALDAAGLGRVTQQAVSLMLLRVEARVLKKLEKQVKGVKVGQTRALWQEDMQGA